VFEPFSLPFVQRGLLEVLLLSVAAGLLGTWIVLRGLAFYAHAVGTAAFPGLVLADGLGFAAWLGAFGAALVFTAGVAGLARRPRAGYDSLTALVLIGCLAAGVILASDVFHSGSNLETLLFGSLLVLDRGDVVLAAVASAVALGGSLVMGWRWLAIGFDADAARALGVGTLGPDLVLLVLVALASVAALSAVGALLTTALFVVPAATARLFTRRMGTWQLASIALAAAEGTVGLWLSVKLNAPPGATIATLAGGVFAVVALARMAPRPAVAAAAATLALVALAGCGGSGDGGGNGGPDRVRVVASTTQLGDLARTIGGSAVDVHQILQPNTDPHDYEPRPRDVEETAKARLVFESGDNLDAWMGKVVSQSGSDGRVIDVGKHMPVRRGSDPHWWHDPVNAQAAIVRIRNALAAADPAHALAYDRNARAFDAKLRLLDAGIQRCLAHVPPGERKLVTDHDAFGYFAGRYGIRVIGAVIPSQTTQAQASAKEVARLSETIRREHVKAVFPETSVNDKLAKAIARETGASARYELYGDTLGPAGSPGATYLTMERANADAMVRGFTGGRRGCPIAGL
jgi:ABC-type Zn uptake system ZnuABC Zn-binding protein ZnuA/ABC-type Mn2+/Zn2+ transport system permease subunit